MRIVVNQFLSTVVLVPVIGCRFAYPRNPAYAVWICLIAGLWTLALLCTNLVPDELRTRGEPWLVLVAGNLLSCALVLHLSKSLFGYELSATHLLKLHILALCSSSAALLGPNLLLNGE